ncbi:hypothetical protein [Pseudoduganella sp. GCM10020061]|jgi:hypothetical protein|uniref:hypothetical protein n=1 Tax=Pseudoduganella sp. GCM10020061 TaxID=3317345 RepID=UPI00363F79D7
MSESSNRNGAEALADKLSECADAIHERVVNTIKGYEGRDVPASEQAALRMLWDHELVLRQRANGLYAEAAASAVATLGEHREQLTRITGTALDKIKTIRKVGDAVGLVAALAALAGAAALGQPAPIIAALAKLRTQVTAMAA